MSERTIREPDQIRRDRARKLRGVQVSDHFQAILGCLLGAHHEAHEGLKRIRL